VLRRRDSPMAQPSTVKARARCIALRVVAPAAACDPARESSESGSIGATMRVCVSGRRRSLLPSALVQPAWPPAGLVPASARSAAHTGPRWHGCSRAAAHRFWGHPCDHAKVAACPAACPACPGSCLPHPFAQCSCRLTRSSRAWRQSTESEVDRATMHALGQGRQARRCRAGKADRSWTQEFGLRRSFFFLFVATCSDAEYDVCLCGCSRLRPGIARHLAAAARCRTIL
jgi:hypothetical protein